MSLLDDWYKRALPLPDRARVVSVHHRVPADQIEAYLTSLGFDVAEVKASIGLTGVNAEEGEGL